jgi:hypothetical protein
MAEKNRVNKYFVNAFNFFTILEGYVGSANARFGLAGRLAGAARRERGLPSARRKIFPSARANRAPKTGDRARR